MYTRPWLVLAFAGFICLSGCSNKDGSSASAPVHANAPTQPVSHPLPPEPLTSSWKGPEVRITSGQIKDVYVDDKNITKFNRAQHIYEAKVSPSNRYLLVWHMDYAPRKVSVYDLQDGTTVSTFEPGAGGSIGWAAHDLIYHQYGAGTNTALWGVYAIDGHKQWSGFASGASLDDSGRFVLVYPTLSVTKEEILVADVRDGRVFARTRPEGIACVLTYRWLDGQTIRVWYEALDGETKPIDMNLCLEKPESWDAVYHVESL
jgi:hypothetical protein